MILLFQLHISSVITTFAAYVNVFEEFSTGMPLRAGVLLVFYKIVGNKIIKRIRIIRFKICYVILVERLNRISPFNG